LYIRAELNQRLQNGEPAKDLVAWLNSLPDVQAVLNAQFAGNPVNEVNISAWRQGGFQDWLQVHEKRDCITAFLEESIHLASTDSELPNGIATFLAADFALTARALLKSAPDPETRWRLLRQLLPAATRLRADQLRYSSAIKAENQLRDQAVTGIALLRYFGGLGGSPRPAGPPQPAAPQDPKPE
jgi:hypothetical protein